MMNAYGMDMTVAKRIWMLLGICSKLLNMYPPVHVSIQLMTMPQRNNTIHLFALLFSLICDLILFTIMCLSP